ncbi:response regulator [Nostoc muscorum FACHB-395]|nr:response regulator [Desmonostoc muscorum FACHB-395]
MEESFEATQSSDQKTYIDMNVFKGLVILLVDDNKSHLNLISYFLSSHGVHVIMAESALSAFELIQQQAVDILISDIAMPGKDGYWLMQQIRSLPVSQNRKIPAIALSGVSKEECYEKLFASGFQSYIQKPSNPIGLITEMAKLLLPDFKNH